MQKTVWLENNVVEDIEVICSVEKLSFSKVVNQALKAYVANHVLEEVKTE